MREIESRGVIPGAVFEDQLFRDEMSLFHCHQLAWLHMNSKAQDDFGEDKSQAKAGGYSKHYAVRGG